MVTYWSVILTSLSSKSSFYSFILDDFYVNYVNPEFKSYKVDEILLTYNDRFKITDKKLINSKQ